MKRTIKNSNEKSDRNRAIYDDRESGLLVVEIGQKYDLSVPRIHRICMQEENKILKEQNEKLKEQNEINKTRINQIYGENVIIVNKED